jgi:uncharacterized coiled-coil protein SlyX
MPEAREVEARLLVLEEKVAYQDKTILELNDVVVDLQRRLTELRSSFEVVERTLRQELGPRELPDEKPPHY